MRPVVSMRVTKLARCAPDGEHRVQLLQHTGREQDDDRLASADLLLQIDRLLAQLLQSVVTRTFPCQAGLAVLFAEKRGMLLPVDLGLVHLLLHLRVYTPESALAENAGFLARTAEH